MRDLTEEIAAQMEIGAEFSDGFVSFKSGDIYRIHDFDPNPGSSAMVESGLLRMIPVITSQELYIWMVEFTKEVHSDSVREKLESALKGVSAVWKFNNVLYHSPEWAERWDYFKRAKLLQSAQEWMESLTAR